MTERPHLRKMQSAANFNKNKGAIIMEEKIKNIIRLLGEDLNREGLKNTPHRAAEALRFLTQ